MKRLLSISGSRKIKNIISCIIVAVLLVLALDKCSSLLELKTSTIKYTPFYEAKTNYDVIFLGSSHMYNTVYPMELWRDYGISSFNWGYSNCTPAVEYYLLQDLIKYTSPKLVVIDAYGIAETGHWTRYSVDSIGHYHAQFDRMPLSKVKIDAAEDVFEDYSGRADFIWDFMLYHNRWNILGKDDFDYDCSTEKGAEICSGTLGRTTYSKIPDGLKSDELYGFNMDAYLKMIEFCNEHDIPVLCVYTPCAAQEYNQRAANTMGDMVEEYPDCRYANMLNEGILNFDTDFIEDNDHLNYSGGTKTTAWMGQYLRDNYELDDYSENEYWKKDYEDYYEHKISLMMKQKSLPLYLPHLADEDLMAEAVIYDKRVLEFDQMNCLFDNAGISPKVEEGDGDICAALTIRSNRTGEIVEEASFKWEDPDDPHMFGIVKVK